jgi:hypothetical protein
LFRREHLLLTTKLDLNEGCAILVDEIEGKETGIMLHMLVVKAASNETLHIEDGRSRVDGTLVLGGLTHEALSVSECDP